MFLEEFIQDQVRADLKEGVVEVVFTKADGSTRTMKCTKKEDVLPPSDETGEPRLENQDICIVWDVEKDDWRTFRWDRVQSVSTQLVSEAGMPVSISIGD